MKSSPSIWHYVVSVKLTVKILSIFVAFLENMNFNFGKLKHAWKKLLYYKCYFEIWHSNYFDHWTSELINVLLLFKKWSV